MSKIRDHKMFREVSAVIDIPNFIASMDSPHYTEFNGDNVSVLTYNIAAEGRGDHYAEVALRNAHHLSEAYKFLNYVGYGIITLEINKFMAHRAEVSDKTLTMEYMDHLVECHDGEPHRLLNEMWANVWANIVAEKLNLAMLYPPNLVQADVDWYNNTFYTLKEEVSQGKWSIAYAIYMSYVDKIAGLCASNLSLLDDEDEEVSGSFSNFLSSFSEGGATAIQGGDFPSFLDFMIQQSEPQSQPVIPSLSEFLSQLGFKDKEPSQSNTEGMPSAGPRRATSTTDLLGFIVRRMNKKKQAEIDPRTEPDYEEGASVVPEDFDHPIDEDDTPRIDPELKDAPTDELEGELPHIYVDGTTPDQTIVDPEIALGDESPSMGDAPDQQEPASNPRW